MSTVALRRPAPPCRQVEMQVSPSNYPTAEQSEQSQKRKGKEERVEDEKQSKKSKKEVENGAEVEPSAPSAETTDAQMLEDGFDGKKGKAKQKGKAKAKTVTVPAALEKEAMQHTGNQTSI